MPPSTAGGQFKSRIKTVRDIDVVVTIAIGHSRTNRSLLELHVRAERGLGLQMQLQVAGMRSGFAYYMEYYGEKS